MSKPVKTLIKQELAKRFDEVTSVAICGFTGLDSGSTYAMRTRLAEKGIKVTVVKNSLAKAAFKEAGLDIATDLLEGPCAVAYGADSIVSVVRELLAINKDMPAFTVKGAILDGDVFSGDEQVKALSKFPTREEALSQLVGCILSAGSNISGALMGPAGQIAGILSSIEQKGE
ncbi:MAG TPA: 50S ribosomal protein L10 [Phycisphaerae bacterium]|nr:50S ribosomal protein L10 [Phycisphaerae bacterium]HPS52020.1 50S ribosomal protein L10 [Phycisphaerae bacterium]